MSNSRKLGEQERLLNYMHPYGGLMPLEVLHIRGPVDPASIEQALIWLQRQHPMLRAHIRHGGLVFRRLPPFVYRQPYFHTEGTAPIPFFVAKGPWEDVLRAEMGRPIKGRRTPRLRVTLVPDTHDPDLSHLILAADHACLDAKAAHLISRDLLEYLADPATMQARKPARDKLPPALEDHLPPAPPSAKPYLAALRLPRQRVPRGKRGTVVMSRCIEQPQADALRAAVLANRTSTHGVISAAFLLAMRERYGVEEMTCMSSVDLRRLCKPPLPAETFGCYIDVLRTRHKLDADLWALARDVSFKIVTAIAKDRQSASFLKLPEWEVYAKETWPTITHNRRLDGLGVTTAGDSGLKAVYGNHTLEAITMAVAVDMTGPSILVLGAERLGAIDLSICYAADALPEEDAVAMTEFALAALTSVRETAEA